MMLFDSHMHTVFSADSEMKAEDALNHAETLGLGLVFTEHYDDGFFSGGLEFSFSPEDYWTAYEPLRGDRLRLGVELGLTSENREANRAFLARAPFDLVIGSIHLVGGKDLYEQETFAGREKGEFYREYYRTMAEEAAAQEMDVLGHIDYICRKAPFANPEVDYGSFREEIDAVLRILVERGIALELNTRRLGSRLALKELAPVYRRYHELGGSYVTLGSDAHNAEAIGAQFERAADFAEGMGLSIVTFCGRKPEIVRK